MTRTTTPSNATPSEPRVTGESRVTGEPVGGGPVPPIIAGSGSAADHGAQIGSNVTIGPGVVIGSQTTKRPGAPAAPIDFDPKRFDVLAYLPKARALARKIHPDAEFTEFEFYENVRRDGFADLTLRTESTSYYEFRSPKASVGRRIAGRSTAAHMRWSTSRRPRSEHGSPDGECDHAIHTPPNARSRRSGSWRPRTTTTRRRSASCTMASGSSTTTTPTRRRARRSDRSPTADSDDVGSGAALDGSAPDRRS
jgi:hypothetical protein